MKQSALNDTWTRREQWSDNYILVPDQTFDTVNSCFVPSSRGILWVVQTSDVSLVLFYIPRHVVCCDCIAIVWIAMGLVGLYEQRKQFLCVWQLWVVQYQLRWMPLPLALVPCIPLSVFVSCLGRPQLVRGGFGPPFWRGFMALQSHKLYDSPIVTPPWSRLTFLPRLAVIWMLV